MEDNELIWENYITANWGYTNYNTPTSNKYTDIPSPTQDSYYQKGKLPASPGQSTYYTPSSDEEEINDDILIDFGTIFNHNYDFIQLFVLLPYKFVYSDISHKLNNTNRFKAMIFRIVNLFIKNNPGYMHDVDSDYYFKNWPIRTIEGNNKNKVYKLKDAIIIDKEGNIINKQMKLNL